MEDYLLIIDGSSLLSTQFYGNLPKEIMFAKTPEEKEKHFGKIMQTSKGVYTNAVFGFVRSLIKIIKDQKPAYLAVTWDITRNTFRRELYSDYKGNRSETIKPLKDQFDLCMKVLEKMGVKQFYGDTYEADDYSGTLAKLFEDEVPVRIMTKDRDYLQLVDDRTNLWMISPNQKKTDELFEKYGIERAQVTVADRAFNFDPELVKKEFGVEPRSVSSLKGIAGDSADNIKGVPGVGEQTAIALIANYLTVEALYDAIDAANVEGEASLKELSEFWKTLGVKRSPISALTKESDDEIVGRKAAFLSKKLATIVTDIDLGDLALSDLRLNIDADGTKAAFAELEFTSIKVDFAGEGQASRKPNELITISDIEEGAKTVDALLKSAKVLGLAVFRDDEGIAAMSITADEEKTYCFPRAWFMRDDFFDSMIEKVFASKARICSMDIKKLLHDVNYGSGQPDEGSSDAASKGESGASGSLAQKTDRLASNSSGKYFFDAGIGAYLLDPLAGSYPYNEISEKYLNMTVGDEKTLVGKKSLEDLYNSDEDSWAKAVGYASMVPFLAEKVLPELISQNGMEKIFMEIEMPLVITLFKMENVGIMVNREELLEYGKKLSAGISMLEADICKSAGEEFNINSPKQLGVILFEKMRLPYFGKKTKTGYSTSADVLEKIRLEDPIVEKILEYRQLTKLMSTYVTGLEATIEKDGRIRGCFNQTVTATGRLSSTEPNLQNIPIRMELGRLIRRMFVPKEGCVFLDADYSQIELRLLAHLSGDELFIRTFNEGGDVHAMTASKVFKVPLEEVTKQQRSNAKAVNFGIVYGISTFGLASDLNIPRKEAEGYIKGYFETYHDVKAYLDRIVADANEKGYAETMYGRRRPIPELSSSNFNLRSFGERAAMNSPIQGSAADVIKIAMNRVSERLERELKNSHLILQVHDELLVEAGEDEADRAAAIMQEEMEGVAALKVKLTAEVGRGRNWMDAH